MPFNRAFREKQKELKEKRKNRNTNKDVQSTIFGARDVGDPIFPEQDIHCKPMTISIKGKVDKYGNWQRS